MDSHRVETFRVHRDGPGGENRERTAWMSRRLEELQGGLAREVGNLGGPQGLKPPLQHEASVLQQQLRDLSKILRSTALSSTSLLRTFHKLVLRTEMFLQQLSELQSAAWSDKKDDEGNDDEDVNVEDEGSHDNERIGEEGDVVDEADAESKKKVEDEKKDRTRMAPSPESTRAEDNSSDMELCDSPPVPERIGRTGRDGSCEEEDRVRVGERERERSWQREGGMPGQQQGTETAWTPEEDNASREATWMTSVLQFQFIADCAVKRHQELMEAVDEYRRFQELGELDPLVGEVLQQHDRVVDLACRQVTPLSTLVSDLCDLDAKVEQLCRILHSRSRTEREKEEQRARQWDWDAEALQSLGKTQFKGKGSGKHSMITGSERSS